jgi:hypothetical protein
MFDGFIAVNQYGHTMLLREPRHPRKQLLAALGRQRCEKMYLDASDGAKHIGYVVGGLNGEWWSIYRASQDWCKEVK